MSAPRCDARVRREAGLLCGTWLRSVLHPALASPTCRRYACTYVCASAFAHVDTHARTQAGECSRGRSRRSARSGFARRPCVLTGQQCRAICRDRAGSDRARKRWHRLIDGRRPPIDRLRRIYGSQHWCSRQYTHARTHACPHARTYVHTNKRSHIDRTAISTALLPVDGILGMWPASSYSVDHKRCMQS